jgi:TonB family protein
LSVPVETPVDNNVPADEWKIDPEDSQEQGALPFDAAPEIVPAPVVAASAGRCESCGGPAASAALCAPCERAFHAVLDNGKDAIAEAIPDPAERAVAQSLTLSSAAHADADTPAPAPNLDELFASLDAVPPARAIAPAVELPVVFEPVAVVAPKPEIVPASIADAAPMIPVVASPIAPQEPTEAAPAAIEPPVLRMPTFAPLPEAPVLRADMLMSAARPAAPQAPEEAPAVRVESPTAFDAGQTESPASSIVLPEAPASIAPQPIRIKATEIQVKPPQPVEEHAAAVSAASSHVEKAARSVEHKAVEKAAAAVVALPPASSSRTGRGRSLVGAAAVVLAVAAIGVPLSSFWFGRQRVIVGQQTVAPQSAQPSPAPKKPAAADRVVPAAAPAVQPAPVASVSTAVKPAAATAAANTTAAARTQPKPKPRAAASANVAPIAAPAIVEAPAPLPIPAAEVAVPEPRRVEAPAAAPAGPFFETRQVDSAPQVTSRVDPQVPARLQGRAVHEIVIVRVLVSQTGQPALVSLLRGSKSGLDLDEAVIAAVKRWTFTPASKRGAAVSCFLHVGVAVKN